MATVRYATSEGALDEGRRLSARHLSNSSVAPFVKVYKRRWLMLAIFVLCTIADAIHWLQYSIIAKSVTKHYRVSTIVIDLTGMMFSITFIAFVFPAIWMIETYGLKSMLILGDILMIVGSGMKIMSFEPKFFYSGFAGQILIGVAQVFIVNVTSYLAGLWFPSSEVSTACAIGVLGTQIGIALGFFIPPLIVHEAHDEAQLKMDFLCLYTVFAVLPTLALPLLLFFFKSMPPTPPSLARIGPAASPNEKLLHVIWDLMRNKNYSLMVLSYSLSVATFYCISVLLDQLIIKHYEDDRHLAGISGTVLIVCGIFGCLASGWVMDKTHKFKLMAIVMYLLSLIGLTLFWASLHMRWYYIVLVAASILGFFMVSYVIVAIEFSSEVTYPINETASTSVLLMFGEVASVLLIYISAELMEQYDGDDTPVICTTSVFLIVGMIVTCCFTDVHLKRYQAAQGARAVHSAHPPSAATAAGTSQPHPHPVPSTTPTTQPQPRSTSTAAPTTQPQPRSTSTAAPTTQPQPRSTSTAAPTTQPQPRSTSTAAPTTQPQPRSTSTAAPVTQPHSRATSSTTVVKQ